MSGFYKFPAMALPDGHSRIDQMGKLFSETDEVDKARRELALAYDFCDDRDEIEMYRTAYGMELMDVIHATETALRMEFGDDEVIALQLKVVEKNRRRGYYGKDEK